MPLELLLIIARKRKRSVIMRVGSSAQTISIADAVHVVPLINFYPFNRNYIYIYDRSAKAVCTKGACRKGI